MPISCAYECKQTPTHLLIEVPLKGAASKSVDIVATDLFVKVSFEKYLLQLDLLYAIDDTACVAKIKQGKLLLKLQKYEAASWPAIVVENLGKDALKARRDAALEVGSH